METDKFSAESIENGLSTRFVGRELYFFDSLPTTMVVADSKANEGAPDGAAVVADHQTAGRGRFDRTWITARGASIAVSIILRPRAEELPKMHMIASLAVAQSIEEACGLSPRIKWPNDVLIGGKKVSGILLTSTFQGDKLGHANMGIGINVNLDRRTLEEITPPATSLSAELGCPVSRLKVFCALMSALEDLYLLMREGGDILAKWKPYLVTLGQQVRVQWRREDLAGYVEEGYAEDVDQDGRLVLRLADGSTKTLSSGEVTLHSQGP